MIGFSFLDESSHAFLHPWSVIQGVEHLSLQINTISHGQVLALLDNLLRSENGSQRLVGYFCCHFQYLRVQFCSLENFTHHPHLISSFCVDEFRCENIPHRVDSSCYSSHSTLKFIRTSGFHRCPESVLVWVRAEQTWPPQSKISYHTTKQAHILHPKQLHSPRQLWVSRHCRKYHGFWQRYHYWQNQMISCQWTLWC